MGGAAVDDDAVEDDVPGNPWPRATTIVATTATSPATRPLRIGVRWNVVRAGSREVTPPFQAARRCRRVCGFRYARDMRGSLASEDARLARRGRAPHGGRDPR